MVVSHSIVMPTVEYTFAPRHLKLYAYKTPSRHVLKHTITKAFLLKNGALIKPVIARLFLAMGHNGFFEKSYHKKAPHCLTKNDNHIGALHVQNLYAYKAHNGSSFRRLGCSAIRAENFAEQSRSAAQKNLRPLYRGRTMPYALQSMAKEYRRHLHLYSCIISYPFLFVNKIQTFVRISMLKFDYTCCNFILKCFIMFDKNHCGPKLHEQIFNLNTRISIYKVQRFIPNI